MLEGLNAIDWSNVEHAYGPATDVPDMIRALASDKERRGAIHSAYGNIFHQGTRYTATPKAIPFLVEIAAHPSSKTKHDILVLLVHCIAGYFGPTGGPYNASGATWGEVTRPMADYGETTEILEACEVAAEPAVPLCLRLSSEGDAETRAAAIWLLASLRRFADRYEVLPRLRERFTNEKEPSVRAMLAFAFTHLGGDVLSLFSSKDHDVVRLVAAMGCVRRGEATPEIASALVGWLDDDDLDGAYQGLPFGADDLPGDIGHLLGALGPKVLASALPALIEKLSTADDFGAVGILEAALAATFGEEKGPKEASKLTADQRKLLETLAHNQNFWTIGNALNVLLDRDLPSMRETMAEWLGIEVTEDPVEAARMGARMFQGFGPERELQAWMEMLTKYDDFEALARAGMLCVQLDFHEQSLQLLEMAMAKKNATNHELWSVALFSYGNALSNNGRFEEALDAFTRAQPLLDEDNLEMARQNRIAMLQRLGRAEDALAIEMERSPDDDDAMGHYHRGLAQVKAGKWRECIESIRKSLALEPDHANSHYTIACAHALLGEKDLALAAIEKALAIEPELASDIASDSDFESIAGDPRFHKLVRQ